MVLTVIFGALAYLLTGRKLIQPSNFVLSYLCLSVILIKAKPIGSLLLMLFLCYSDISKRFQFSYIVNNMCLDTQNKPSLKINIYLQVQSTMINIIPKQAIKILRPQYKFKFSLQQIRNHPYVRLCRYDKPIGYWLLYWPTVWGVASASSLLPSVGLLSMFLMGSMTSRAAGCIINDYFDKDFDRMVQRTKSRPLAAKQVTTKEALALLFINLCGGLYVLTQLPFPALAAVFTILPVAGLYPFAKRLTKYPQLILGIAFNSGIIIGALTVSPFSPHWSVIIPLYTAGICWTLVYDTVYAFQDRQDDLKIGINSTAVTWGEKSMDYMKYLIGVSSSMFCLISYLDSSFLYGLPIQIVGHIYLYLQLRKVDANITKTASIFFKKNNYFGILIFLSIVFGKYMNVKNNEQKQQQVSYN